MQVPDTHFHGRSLERTGALQPLILLSAPTIVIGSCPPHTFSSFPHHTVPRDFLKCPQHNSRYGKIPVRFDMSEAFTEFPPDLVHNFLLIEKALILDLLHHPFGNIVCDDHLESFDCKLRRV